MTNLYKLDEETEVESRPLIHGMWTSFDDLIEIVRGYDDMDATKVDAAINIARENGVMNAVEMLRAEKPEDRLVAPVITVNRATVHETLLLGRSCAQQVWFGQYMEWKQAYAGGVDEKRVEMIPGARHFVPNEIMIHIVDFGANWDPWDGNVLREIQKAQAMKLAGLEVIFAMSQHPEWVRQMDGKTVPEALAAALLLSVPNCGALRSDSPRVWYCSGKAGLHGYRVGRRFRRSSMPLIREFVD